MEVIGLLLTMSVLCIVLGLYALYYSGHGGDDDDKKLNLMNIRHMSILLLLIGIITGYACYYCLNNCKEIVTNSQSVVASPEPVLGATINYI